MEVLCVQESRWCLFQTTGDAAVHRRCELPWEAGQLYHALRNLHRCRQRGQLCVCLEHGHRLVEGSQWRAHALLCINCNSCLSVLVWACACVGLLWLPCSAGIGRTSFVFVVKSFGMGFVLRYLTELRKKMCGLKQERGICVVFTLCVLFMMMVTGDQVFTPCVCMCVCMTRCSHCVCMTRCSHCVWPGVHTVFMRTVTGDQVFTLCVCVCVCDQVFTVCVCVWPGVHTMCVWPGVHTLCVWPGVHTLCVWPGVHTVFMMMMITGDQVARYTELNYLKPVTDVAYHPRDHILAICSLGENQPVLIYKYDPFSK